MVVLDPTHFVFDKLLVLAWSSKVETPYHDNDLILTPIIHHKVVGNEPKVARNFTWAVLVIEDGNFRV